TACWFESSLGHQSGEIEIYIGFSIFIFAEALIQRAYYLNNFVYPSGSKAAPSKTSFSGKVEPIIFRRLEIFFSLSNNLFGQCDYFLGLKIYSIAGCGLIIYKLQVPFREYGDDFSIEKISSSLDNRYAI